MKSDDYLEKIEQHRQEIRVETNGQEQVRSRIELHRNGRKKGNKKGPKRKSNTLLSTIFGIFILIPVGFLIYVIAFYEPETMETATQDNQFKMEVNTPEDDADLEVDGQDPSADQETATGEENDDPDGSTSKDNTQTNEQPVKDPDNSSIVEKEEETKTPPVSEGRTHTVAPGETLFRIAMNFYGTPDGVEKIKSANGLSSNEISAGQTLIIP